MKYVFDIDGTLTDSRRYMDSGFALDFCYLCRKAEVYLVTGSDYNKVKEQIPPHILDEVKATFACMGNSIWKRSVEVYKNDWKPSQFLLNTMNLMIDKSQYPIRAGNHIEERIGMVNMSTVGRNATLIERANYAKWDTENKERLKIQKELIEIFADELDILIGGQISIDIIPKGMDKAQVLNHLDGPITFFGDKVKNNENDRSIVNALLNRNESCRVIKVLNWKDTRSYISDLFHK